MVFFGLRGCVPLDIDDNGFRDIQQCRVVDTDYRHLRCTIGQWLLGEKSVAIFLASTVPHVSYVHESTHQHGAGANQLMTGCYDDYRKGIHKAGTPYATGAFQQTAGRAVRRTCDDCDYDTDDRVDYENTYDNLHAAWCMGLDDDSFASRGCQVVAGYPDCPKRGSEPPLGPWAEFKRIAYATSQTVFPYVLLTGSEALQAAICVRHTILLRWGSHGETVRLVQQALADRGYFHGDIDGQFGRRTLNAVLQFQKTQIAPSGGDGIVGPITAGALGINLPLAKRE
jgi:hypothetical protein